MNKIAVFVVGIISVTISSCDYFSGKLKVIDNQSDHDLQVRIHKGSRAYYPYDSIFLVPHKSELRISDYSTPRGTHEVDICEINADSITASVINNDTLRVIANLTDTANWTYHVISINKKHGHGESECRIVITNADIE